MARRHKLRVLQREWEKLRDIAVKKAKEQNYTYQDGALFTPEALEAKKRVDHYLKTRDEVLKYGELPTYEQDELAKLLEQQQQRYREIQEFTQHYGPSLKYQEVFTQLTALTAYKTYIDAIIKVADYGLAVPEFALIMASGGAGSVREERAPGHREGAVPVDAAPVRAPGVAALHGDALEDEVARA